MEAAAVAEIEGHHRAVLQLVHRATGAIELLRGLVGAPREAVRGAIILAKDRFDLSFGGARFDVILA